MIAAFLSFLAWGGTLLRLVSTILFQAWLALPRWAKELILVAVALLIVYYMGEHRGADRVQNQWDAAQQQAVEHNTQVGETIRENAEKAVPPVDPTDPRRDAVANPRIDPCRVFDPNDRDCKQGGGR